MSSGHNDGERRRRRLLESTASRDGDRRRDARIRRSPPDDAGRRSRHNDNRDREYGRERGSMTDSRRGKDDSHMSSRRHEEHEKRSTRRRDEDSRSPRRERPRDRSKDRDRERRHDRHTSPSRSHRRSPPPKRRRRSYESSESPVPTRSRQALPSQEVALRRANGDSSLTTREGNDDTPVEKQKPNYGSSGLLAKEANTVAGTTTVLKYHEPPEARKPPGTEAWRMYIFKDKDLLDTVHLYGRSCWLMGRDDKVTDLLLEHPSISKQHAVIQFRYIARKNEYGDSMDTVRPYLIDLESANGTRLNGEKVAGSRYVELRDGDVVRFGDSLREYVMMLPPSEAE